MTQPAPALDAAPPDRRWRILACAAAALIMLVYGFYYGRLIALSTAVPTFDQAAYMAKTYHIADAIHAHPLQALNPLTYFSEPSANRPPLLMAIAGIILGPDATPQSIGILWLVVRLAVLFTALCLLARRVASPAFLPAAALTILAAPGGLTLYPNMYMVDQAFEAFGLLAFVFLTDDEAQHTSRSAARGALATLLLLLVKPAALVLLFPLYVLLLRRGVRIIRGETQPGAARRALIGWLWPYAILAALMLLLFLTPHPLAVANQYQLGARGYWATGKDFLQVTGLIALVIPPWLIAMSGIALIGSGRRNISLAVPAAAAVVCWWYFFNAVLSYTLDPRIISAAMPIAVVAAFLAIARSRRLTAAATILAALTFGLALLGAQGRLADTPRRFVAILMPLAEPQQPPAEVGLLDAARRIAQITSQAAPSAADAYRSRRLMLVTSDDFVENAAMHLAFRFTNSNPDLTIDSHPWGAENFRIAPLTSNGIMSFEWFLTKQRRKEPAINPLHGDVFVPLYAVDALIVDPESPLHDSFEKQCDLPIHPMNGFDDTVTLWRLREVPPPDKLLAALRFVQPRFKGTHGEPSIADQIARLTPPLDPPAASPGTRP